MFEIKYAWVSETVDKGAPVYIGQDYQSMLATYDGSEPRVLACTKGTQTSYIPMLVRSLESGLKEAYSAYGYGGLWGGLSLSAADLSGLQRFLADAGIVALFVRHSPFLANQLMLPENVVELNRHTYAAALKVCEGFDSYLSGLPQKLRWSVKSARRSGLSVSFRRLSECPENRLKAFYRLYAYLMQQKQTSDYYLFSERFFLEHANKLGEQCELAEIVDEKSGSLLAGAFFLMDETGWTHYHLSAAVKEVMKLQGMELLLASAIYRYGNSGYHSLHLGGGHSLDECDGLSRFKSKFSSQRLDFCCSKLICDEVGYQRERARRPLANPSFFLISDARG